MPQLTIEQRGFLVETFIRTESIGQTLKAFEEKFVDRKPPTRANVRHLIIKFKKDGTVWNLNKNRSGRKRTARTDEKRRLIEAEVVDKVTSVRRIASATDISKSSAQRIMRRDIKVKPYRLIVTQGLSPDDKVKRKAQSSEFLTLLRRIRLPLLFFSDECNFYLDGTVNRYNSVAWCYNRPDWHTSEKKIGSPKVCVWAALSSDHLIGPYFFESTVGKHEYCRCLHEYAIPKIRECVGDQFCNTWFQQDGAPGHTSLRARDILREAFGTKTIGKFLSHHWPARSPDLNVCDFFLWSYLKDIVFAGQRPVDMNDLKARITAAFDTVRARRMQQVRNAVGQWRRRLRACISAEGAQVDPLLRWTMQLKHCTLSRASNRLLPTGKKDEN